MKIIQIISIGDNLSAPISVVGLSDEGKLYDWIKEKGWVEIIPITNDEFNIKEIL